MSKAELSDLLNSILTKRGLDPFTDEAAELRVIGFRSLDFSEMALRVERGIKRELHFDAAQMRAIRTVSDVLGFFENACKADA